MAAPWGSTGNMPSSMSPPWGPISSRPPSRGPPPCPGEPAIGAGLAWWGADNWATHWAAQRPGNCWSKGAGKSTKGTNGKGRRAAS
eukprot:7479786-Pyramimonas_sp.AAC.1